MSVFTRRSLLKVIAGLTAFIPTARVLAKETPLRPIVAEGGLPPPTKEDIEAVEREIAEKYLEGSAVSVDGSAVSVQDRTGKVTLVKINPETHVWKGGWKSPEPIEVGDEIVVWGRRTSETTHLAEQLYSNIVNLIGPISRVQRFSTNTISFTLQDRYKGEFLVNVQRDTEIVDSESELAKDFATLQLNENQLVQVVGLLHKDKSVRATKAFA